MSSFFLPCHCNLNICSLLLIIHASVFASCCFLSPVSWSECLKLGKPGFYMFWMTFPPQIIHISEESTTVVLIDNSAALRDICRSSNLERGTQSRHHRCVAGPNYLSHHLVFPWICFGKKPENWKTEWGWNTGTLIQDTDILTTGLNTCAYGVPVRSSNMG